MSKKVSQTIVWEPQPKQSEALVRNEFEVLYGGARGGGKTDAGIAWLLYPIWEWINAVRSGDFEKAKQLARYRSLIIRRNANDLNDWLDRAQYIYKNTFGEMVEFVGKPVEIRFKIGTIEGPIFRTGHLKDEDAYQKYQGHEYQRILIEELTHISDEKNYENLLSSCRSTIPFIEPQIFCTTNPDGPGFYWVKSRFRIPDWPPAAVETQTPFGNRVFILSKLEDNPALNEASPDYGIFLSNIKDESRRKAWREGYWGQPIIEGVIFAKELEEAHLQGRVTEIPHNPNYPVYTWWDIGRDATPILFFQLIGSAWHLIDFYEASGQSFQHYAEVLRSKPYWYGGHYGPWDLEKTDMSNETILQIAERFGINFTIVPRAATADGIEAARIKFPRMWIDKNKCAEYLKRISAFRREFDDDKNVFKDNYLHDWASHAGTATFYWGLTPDIIPPGAMEQNLSLYSTTYN